MEFSTICVKGNATNHPLGAEKTPIFLNNIYSFDNNNFLYGRYDNYNSSCLAKHLLKLYANKVEYCELLPSCMSCLSELLDTYNYDSTILVHEYIYAEFLDLMQLYRNKLNIIKSNLCDIDNFKNIISTNKIDLILIEPLSNPLLDKIDVKVICHLAHANDCKVCVDNTVLTSYSYNPFDDGADIVIESLGKYVVGQGDCFAGALLTNQDLHNRITMKGNILSPFQCYLIQRSLPTLAIRMERIINTAHSVYEYLSKKLNYVKFDGRNGLIVFVLGNERVNNFFLSKLKLIFKGFAFGFEESLIIPSYAPHSKHLPPPWDKHIRLSIGLEDEKDIIDDLEQAFAVIRRDREANPLKYVGTSHLFK